MATLRQTKSGSWTSRKAIPADIRSDYQALYGRGWEEIFNQGLEHSAQPVKVLFSEWQADLDNRFAATGA